MKKTLFYLGVLIFLFSCQEDSSINKISGRVYSDCQNPLANAQIGLKSSAISGTNDPLILTSAITDEDGTFEMTYEVEKNDKGTAELIWLKKEGYATIVKNIPLRETLNLNVYLNNQSTIYFNLKLDSALQPTDTLYYGISGFEVDTFRIQPMAGALDTLILDVPNKIEGGTMATVYYGIGTNDFQLSKEASSLQDSIYQNIPLNLEGCSATEQVEFQIK